MCILLVYYNTVSWQHVNIFQLRWTEIRGLCGFYLIPIEDNTWNYEALKKSLLSVFTSIMNSVQCHNKKTSSLAFLIIFLVGGMFVADLFLNIGIANGAPYVAAILLSLWFPKRLVTLLITVVCTGLTIIGFFTSVGATAIWSDLSNRMIAIITLWFTAILLLHRKRTEEALRVGKEQYQHLIEGSIQGILIHRNGQALFANQPFCDMFGYCTPDQLLDQMDLFDHIASNDRDRFDAHVRSVMQGEQDDGSLQIFQGTQENGTLLWFEIRSHLVHWGGKQAIQSSIYNITDRIRAEDALAARVTQMEAVRMLSIDITRELDLNKLLNLIILRAVELVDAAGAGVIFLWDENKQQLTSQAWHGIGNWIDNVCLSLGEGVTGEVARRRQGMLVTDYQHSPHACAKLAHYVNDVAVLAEPLIYRGQILGVITLSNAEIGLSFSNQDRELLLLIGVQAAIAIENAKLFREVHKQSDELVNINTALRKSEEQYRAFVAQSSEGIYRVEFNHDIQPDSPIAGQLADFYASGFVAECNDVMAQMHGYSCADELVGTRLEALFPSNNKQNKKFFEEFISSGFRVVDAETQQSAPPLHQNKVFLDNLVGIINQGRLKRLWGMRRDITERKQLEESLFQAKKMAAIGTLAGGIAHDFNNILTSIVGYTELSLYDINETSSAWQNLHEVLTASKRAKDLIQQILTFSRQGSQNRCPLYLQLIIKEVLSMLQASLPKNIEVVEEIDKNVGAIMANSTQMHQVVMNLCANAEHAMRKSGGCLVVKLSTIEIDDYPAAAQANLQPGAYIKLEISDTGQGMTSEVKKRIFEPFFTTKGIGEGTGMGLSVVHGIVVHHGGAIEVESQPGQGSIFTIYLPRTNRQPNNQAFAEMSLNEEDVNNAVFIVD